jgi:carboxynorspermidine decarboxylase
MHQNTIQYPQIPSPCYVLEQKALIQNLELLQMVQQKSGAKIICALKGYSLWPTFPLIKQYLYGATASSYYEARLAREEMNAQVHVYAPVYTPNDFEKILPLSDHISFNSMAQWERFKPRVQQYNGQKQHSGEPAISCGIRVNPECSSVDTDLYNPCGYGSRLGVTIDEFKPELLQGIEGLHFHALCEQNSDALQAVLQAFEEKFGAYVAQMKWVNFGGGHHITRADYNIEHLIQLIVQFREKYNVQVILEPGEAVGWQTGFLKTTVQDVVHNRGVYTIMLDASIAAHMPDCLEMPYRPAVRGAGKAGEKAWNCRIGGTTCLAGDFLEDYSFDQPVQPGDEIIFEDMIHYTMVKTTFFNGVSHPHIGMLQANGEFTLLRSQDYQAYKDKLG